MEIGKKPPKLTLAKKKHSKLRSHEIGDDASMPTKGWGDADDRKNDYAREQQNHIVPLEHLSMEWKMFERFE